MAEQPAANWARLTSTLLALFGLAAFIKGPATFTDFGVDGDAAIKLALLASAAGLLSVLALLVIPSVGRGLTSIAAVLVFGVAIAVPILALTKTEPSQHALVQRSSGQVVCGVLAN